MLGTTFILCTDHNSLKWLNSFKHPEGQVARWLEKLSEYNFTIEHRPGRKHSNADSLSRVLPIYSVQLPADALLGMTMSEMRMLQLQDDVIAPVLTAKDDDQRPTEDHVRHYSRDTRRLFQMWDQLMMDNVVLVQLFASPTGIELATKQLVAPKGIQQSILKSLHDGVC